MKIPHIIIGFAIVIYLREGTSRITTIIIICWQNRQILFIKQHELIFLFTIGNDRYNFNWVIFITGGEGNVCIAQLDLNKVSYVLHGHDKILFLTTQPLILFSILGAHLFHTLPGFFSSGEYYSDRISVWFKLSRI